MSKISWCIRRGRRRRRRRRRRRWWWWLWYLVDSMERVNWIHRSFCPSSTLSYCYCNTFILSNRTESL